MKTLSSRDEPTVFEMRRAIVAAADRLVELHEGLTVLSDMIGKLDPITLAEKQFDITDLLDRLAKRATES